MGAAEQSARRIGARVPAAALALLFACSCQLRTPPPEKKPVPPAPALKARHGKPVKTAPAARQGLPEAKKKAPGFYHADGERIVDDTGKPVLLKGCNLGNWLLLEMWMLGAQGIADQYQFEHILAERFGADEKNRLLDRYRAAYVGPKDFEIMRSFGFNVVRVPFAANLLLAEDGPKKLKTGAFKWLDRAVELARASGMTVILDLHGAPGGQSLDHTTGRKGQNHLWTSRAAQDQTVWLWRQIARRYRDEPAVAGYDLLNEPFGDYQSAQHLPALKGLVGRLYQAVRSEDARHLIFIPEAQQGFAFYGNPREAGWENVAFTGHDYPGLYKDTPELETHARFIGQKLVRRAALLKKLNIPFLVGEFNVVLDRLAAPWMNRRYFDEYAAHGWAATLWCYKRIRPEGGLGSDHWSLVVNRDPLPFPALRTASHEAIEAWFTAIKKGPVVVDEAMRRALTTTKPVRLALTRYPPALERPPALDDTGEWTALDIGEALAGGQRMIAPDHLMLYGGGWDIWNRADQFRFLFRKAEGSARLSVRLAHFDAVNPYAKAGVMVRGSLDPDAPHLLLHAFPDGQVVLGWRERKGGVMREQRLELGDLPVWFRLSVKDGEAVLSFSRDGRHETARIRRRFPWLEGPVYIGLAVLGHDANESLAAAEFDRLRVELKE